MNAMEIAFLIAVVGVCVAMVASAFPPYSRIGHTAAPVAGIGGLLTAVIGAWAGVLLWLF